MTEARLKTLRYDGRLAGRCFRACAGGVESVSWLRCDIRHSCQGVDSWCGCRVVAPRGGCSSRSARQMAFGTARLYRQQEDGDRVVGLSTTGVAGPGPDGDKPAGLAYVGCSLPSGFGSVRSRRTEAFELRLQGDRESIRRGVVYCILQKLRELSADSQE